MKKCPNCDKTFDDSMRFCQTDGTPLVEFVEAPADDPLKTTVVRQDELASVIPPEDPFKTSVASASSKDDSGDLLQLPEEFDPMKTVVAKDDSNFSLDVSDAKDDSPFSQPMSPFDAPSAPFEPKIESAPSDYSVPEPPKFNEPSLSPPNFNDMSSSSSEPKFDEPKKTDEPPPTAIYMPESNPFSSEKIDSQEPVSSSPFDKPMDTPFGDSPFNKPADNPFAAPSSSPFSEPPKETYPIPSFQEPEPVVSTPQSSPFDTPSSSPFDAPSSSPFDQPFGGGQMQQQNQGFNQPVQNSDWTPPAAPNAAWQEQGVGANTPFQPPPAGMGQGQNQTLAIVSLICGILSCLCCFSILTGPAALITGFMAKGKADSDPANYGGSGMALGGMFTGAIGTLIGIAAVVLQFLGAFAGRF